LLAANHSQCFCLPQQLGILTIEHLYHALELYLKALLRQKGGVATKPIVDAVVGNWNCM